MRILVIGSLGTIGSPLVDELKRREHSVIEADLRHSDKDNFRRCDIGNYRQVEDLIEWSDPDLVYLLAAEFGRHNGELYYEQCWTTNVIGSRHVMTLCARHGIRLVFMSSSEAYGETPQLPMSETDTDSFPLRHHNDYAMSKWVNEQQIMNMERNTNLECVRIRFFNAYGPGEYYHPFRSVVCLFCYRALTGRPYTIYENYHRVFMYIDDAVNTLANVPEMFIPGRVYNVGGEEYRSVEDVHAILQDMLGDEFRSNVEVLSRDGHNTVNKRPAIEAAVRELGHRLEIKLEGGIARTLRWMRNTYQL